MLKKIICLCLIVCLALPLGGCWSRQELSDLAIVIAAGVDRTPDGNILLTVQIARPQAFSSGSQQSASTEENNIWVIGNTGETVMDAARCLEAKVSRRLYWSHNVILVFGEQLAANGLRQATNFFTRTPEVRETNWTFIAKGKAADVINSHSQLESTSAQALGNTAKSDMEFSVMLKDLSMMLASYGTNPALPVIELTPSGNPQGPGMLENLPEAAEQNQNVTKTHAEAAITGTGVFRDDKLVGWLDSAETNGFLWLMNKVKERVITINAIKEPDKKISILTTRTNTEIEPYYDGNNVWFDVTVDMEGDLLEQQSTDELTQINTYKEIEKRVSREIESKIQKALDKAQLTYGIDIFAFGEAFHRKYKNDWPAMKEQWNEIFAEADVNIKVESNITRTGLTSNRISKKD